MQKIETPVSFMLLELSDPQRIKYSPLSPDSLAPYTVENIPESAFSSLDEEWTTEFLTESYNSRSD